LIPKVVDGYCKKKKVPDDYRSKVEDRVTRNYHMHIDHRFIDHGLTQDKERRFTPKPSLPVATNKAVVSNGMHDAPQLWLG
jgi:hypothetical protein